MVDVNGMVGWLVQLVQDAHFALGHCRCREDCCTELVLADSLRTAEGEEDAAGLYLFKGSGIKLRVTAKGVLQGILVLGKGRGVKDDEVILFLHLLHELESIFGKRFVPIVSGEIDLNVGINEFDGLGTAIHRVDQLCPTPHGIDAETTGVAEHVEHLAAFGIAFHKGAVVALIYEEARLLSFEPVDMESQAVLASNIVVAFAPNEAVLLPQLGFEWQGRLALIIDGLEVLAHRFP